MHHHCLLFPLVMHVFNTCIADVNSTLPISYWLIAHSYEIYLQFNFTSISRSMILFSFLSGREFIYCIFLLTNYFSINVYQFGIVCHTYCLHFTELTLRTWVRNFLCRFNWTFEFNALWHIGSNWDTSFSNIPRLNRMRRIVAIGYDFYQYLLID